MKGRIVLVIVMLAAVPSAAIADFVDRPTGIKIGQRMTLRPFVSFSASYDSNVKASHDDAEGDVMWTISPTLGISYDAESWSLLLNAFYNYHAYCKDITSDQNRHTWGQDLRWNWTNSKGGEKGWSLMLSEGYHRISMTDEMTLSDGRGYTGDSQEFQVNAALQRRFNEHWHADINASYYWLDYLDDSGYQTYFGWQRMMVGAEVGYALTPWTDFILAGNYQAFTQDNVDGTMYASDSQGYTLQGGIGSYMTERISYRVLAGYALFDYAGGESSSGGFVYTVSGNWKIGETWNTMLLASSYYQPSERQLVSKSRIDGISWGLAKSLVRGKLRATLDVQYRRETNEYVGLEEGDLDYTLDILTGRLGLDYTLNRFLAVFLYGEYQKSWNNESESRYGAYDYDRWRITGGFRMSY